MANRVPPGERCKLVIEDLCRLGIAQNGARLARERYPEQPLVVPVQSPELVACQSIEYGACLRFVAQIKQKHSQRRAVQWVPREVAGGRPDAPFGFNGSAPFSRKQEPVKSGRGFVVYRRVGRRSGFHLLPDQAFGLLKVAAQQRDDRSWGDAQPSMRGLAELVAQPPHLIALAFGAHDV